MARDRKDSPSPFQITEELLKNPLPGVYGIRIYDNQTPVTFVVERPFKRSFSPDPTRDQKPIDQVEASILKTQKQHPQVRIRSDAPNLEDPPGTTFCSSKTKQIKKICKLK